MICQEHLVINVFSKHFGNFHEWQLIHEIHENFPLNKPAIWVHVDT